MSFKFCDSVKFLNCVKNNFITLKVSHQSFIFGLVATGVVNFLTATYTKSYAVQHFFRPQMVHLELCFLPKWLGKAKFNDNRKLTDIQTSWKQWSQVQYYTPGHNYSTEMFHKKFKKILWRDRNCSLNWTVIKTQL